MASEVEHGVSPVEASEVLTSTAAPWYATFARPVVWGPTAAVAAVLVGVLVAVQANASAEQAYGEAAAVVSVTPSPSSASSDAPEPSASPTVSESPRPSASPSTQVVVGYDEGDDDGGYVPQACVPGTSSTAVDVAEDGVLIGDAGSTTTTIAPVSLFAGGFADLQVSADGKTLAMVANDEGTNQAIVFDTASGKVVASHAGDAAITEWSPDLKDVALAWTDDELMYVSVVDSQTGEEELLTTLEGMIPSSFSWSADGRCLLVSHRSTSHRWRDDPGLSAFGAVDVVTGEFVALGIGSDAVYTDTGILFIGVDGDTSAMFSHDGSQTHLSSMDFDGSNVQVRGTSEGGDGSFTVAAGDIVVDTEQGVVVYPEISDYSRSTVRIATTQGEDDEALVSLKRQVSTVALSPDGSFAAFTSLRYEYSNDSVGIVSTSGGDVTWADIEVADNTDRQWLRGLAWLPDGSGLVILRQTQGSKTTASTTQPFLIELDGAVTALSDPVLGLASSPPAWSADGDTMVWSVGDEYWTNAADARVYVVTR